jgi:hypothetical protein
VQLTSEMNITFSISLADPSTHSRWFTLPHQPSNTIIHFQIPCHFLSPIPWLVIAENESFGVSVNLKFDFLSRSQIHIFWIPLPISSFKILNQSISLSQCLLAFWEPSLIR